MHRHFKRAVALVLLVDHYVYVFRFEDASCVVVWFNLGHSLFTRKSEVVCEALSSIFEICICCEFERHKT